MSATARRVRREVIEMDMTRTLEGRTCREDEPDAALAAVGQFDPQRRCERTMEARPEAVIVLQSIEVEIRGAGRDLAGIVEERHVQVAVDHDPPLGGGQTAVSVAEGAA